MDPRQIISIIIMATIGIALYLSSCDKPEIEEEPKNPTVEAEQFAKAWAKKHQLSAPAANCWRSHFPVRDSDYECKISYGMSERKWGELTCNVTNETCAVNSIDNHGSDP